MRRKGGGMWGRDADGERGKKRGRRTQEKKEERSGGGRNCYLHFTQGQRDEYLSE